MTQTVDITSPLFALVADAVRSTDAGDLDHAIATGTRIGELTPDLDPRAFTIETMGARLLEVGDLWREGMRRLNDPRRLLGEGGA